MQDRLDREKVQVHENKQRWKADLDLQLIPSEIKKESYFVVKQKKVEPKIAGPRQKMPSGKSPRTNRLSPSPNAIRRRGV